MSASGLSEFSNSEIEASSSLCTEDPSSSDTESTQAVTIKDPEIRKRKHKSNTSDDGRKRKSSRRVSRDIDEKRKKRSRSRSRSRSKSKSRTSVRKQRLSTMEDSAPSAVAVRSRIVKEILDTESSYIIALETLIENLEPFLQLDMSELEDFPETEARTIHSNGGIILGYSRLLMEMLKPRVESFNDETCIGDIFLRLADFMKVYTLYIKAYQPFMSQFLTFWQKNKAIVQKCALPGANTQFLTFESCLIVPVQRIPRYQLLLNDFLKQTPDTHPDYPSLSQALEKISAVACYVNERQGFYDGIRQVLELYKRFGRQLTDDTGVMEFVRSHRRLLKKGDFTMEKNGKTRSVKVYLLNDLLLVGSVMEQNTEGTKLYKLICLWLVKLVDGPENEFSFIEQENNETLITLCAEDQEHKLTWIKIIENTLETLNTAIMKGSDVETSKVHVAETVQWNKALIPLEIAAALAAEQAEKRNHSEIVSLRQTDDSENSPQLRNDKESRLSRSSSVIHSLPRKLFDRSPGSSPSTEEAGYRGSSSRSSRRSTIHPSTPPIGRLNLRPLRNSCTASTSSPSVTTSQSARGPNQNRDAIPHIPSAPTTPTASNSRSRLRRKSPRSPRKEESIIGRLFVRVLEARKLKFKNHLETKNALVQIQLGDKQYQTPIAKKTVHPVWNENNKFIFDLSPTSQEFIFLDITLLNKKSKGERILGGISIKLSATKIVSRSADKWYALKKNNSDAGDVRIQLHFLSQEDAQDPDKNNMDVFETKTADDSLTLSEQRLVDYLSAMGGSPLPF